MSFKSKIILISTVAILVFVIVNIYVQYELIVPTYEKIENSEARTDIMRCVNGINDRVQNIKRIAKDLTSSTDKDNLIENRLNSEQGTETLEAIMQTNNLDFILFYSNNKKKVVFKNVLDIGISKHKFIQEIEKLVINNNLLSYSGSARPERAHSGLINSPFGILLLATASPDARLSKNNPNAGNIILGNIFNNNLQKKIEYATKVSFKIFPKDEITNVSSSKTIIPSLMSGRKILLLEKSSINPANYNCYTILDDISNKPEFIFFAELPRLIYIEAEKALNFTLYTSIIFGVILIIIAIIIIQLVIIQPITKLTKRIYFIKNSTDLALRTISANRKDEVGVLSAEFNTLLEQHQNNIENKNKIIEEQTKEIRHSREEIIYRLSMSLENKHIGISEHIRSVSAMALLLAEKLKLPKKDCESIRIASTLHDIGKIGLPENIKLNDMKYSDEEFEVMKSHTNIGASIFVNNNSELMETARQITLCHHENWDGSGYPEKLKGDNIPISARITTIVDVFDALLSKKSYKQKNYSIKEAIQFYKDKSGIIFDPKITKVFLENIDMLTETRNKCHKNS